MLHLSLTRTSVTLLFSLMNPRCLSLSRSIRLSSEEGRISPPKSRHSLKQEQMKEANRKVCVHYRLSTPTLYTRDARLSLSLAGFVRRLVSEGTG